MAKQDEVPETGRLAIRRKIQNYYCMHGTLRLRTALQGTYRRTHPANAAQRGTHGTPRHNTAYDGTAQHIYLPRLITVRSGAAWHDTTRHNTAQHPATAQHTTAHHKARHSTSSRGTSATCDMNHKRLALPH